MARSKGRALVPATYGTRKPARTKTWGPDMADFMEQLGVELLPWQRDVADEWLAHDSQGKLIHPTGCLVVPRRNGKSLLLVARSLFGMWWLGERRVSFTAQNHQTAGEIFSGLCDLVEDQAPELLVSKRLANGQQRLEIRERLGRNQLRLGDEIEGCINALERNILELRPGKSVDRQLHGIKATP